MSDVLCRLCGEPYDCTGGLTYTKQSMSWWEYEQFSRGLGCPCCEGDPEYPIDDPEFENRWAWGWVYATEGELPYPEFPQPASPPAWYRGQYRDTYDEPRLLELLSDLDTQGVEATRIQFLDREYDSESGEKHSLVVLAVAGEYCSDRDYMDVIYRANYVALWAELQDKPFEALQDWEGFTIRVGTFDRGHITLDPEALRYIYQTEGALANYPVVDDVLYSQMEAEERGEEEGDEENDE